jgi:hypothetical protein
MKKGNVNWQLLRELLVKGFSYEEVAQSYNVKLRTLVARSYRERWNISGVRAANRIPRPKTERKDSRPQVQTEIVKNGVTLPLVMLANYYQTLDIADLRKEQAAFLSFASTALKLLSSNDPKQSGDGRSVNLQVLAQGPIQIVSDARVSNVKVVDCQSSEKPIALEGSSPDQAAESSKSASELLP